MATYHITNATQLQAMNSDLAGDYILDNDIDLTGVTWTPIGTYAAPFAGSFDGKNKIIKNLTINTPLSVQAGLFGYISNSTISNIGLVDASIIAHAQVGILVGWSVDSTISNSYSEGEIYGDAEVGGLIGYINNGSLSDCYSTATVQSLLSSDGDFGGFIGDGYADAPSYIINCYSTGDVIFSGNGSYHIGGFLGALYSFTIENCYSSGNVYIIDDDTDWDGGFIGEVYNTTIINCYSTGTITITGDDAYAIGGFAGYAEDGSITGCYSIGVIEVIGESALDVGGFLGVAFTVSFEKCYSASDVILDDWAENIGGFIGDCENGVIKNCYSTGNITTVDNAALLGGFIGGAYLGEIKNCYSTGNIDSGYSTFYVGGFIGDYEEVNLINCYSVGILTIGTSQRSVGGFIGYFNVGEGSIANCAWFTSSFSNSIGYDKVTELPIATLAEISAGTDETDNTKLYNVILKTPSHVVYDQGNANAWDFATPIWYEWSTTYPLFTKEALTTHVNNYNVAIRDKNGRLKTYVSHLVTDVKWEWNRLGGCGRATVTLTQDYRKVDFGPRDDIQIWVKDGTTAKLCYRGWISEVIPTLQIGQKVTLDCRGYFDLLKLIVANDAGDKLIHSGAETSLIVTSLMDTFITPNTPITKGTIDATDVAPDYIEFKQDVQGCLRTLAELCGNVEYGVDEHLVFFWRIEDTTERMRFFVGNNVQMMERRIDWSKLVNKIYFQGADIAEGIPYLKTAEAPDSATTYFLSESIISNSSITTDPVADQYLGAILRENCNPIFNIRAKIPNTSLRLEDTVPLGEVVFYDADHDEPAHHWGTASNGGDGLIWGRLVEHGSDAIWGSYYHAQVDRISYSLSSTDGRFNIEIQLGDTILETSAKIKRMENDLANLRER